MMTAAVTFSDVWRLLLSPGLSEAVPPGTERGGSEDESRPRNTLEKSSFRGAKSGWDSGAG